MGDDGVELTAYDSATETFLDYSEVKRVSPEIRRHGIEVLEVPKAWVLGSIDHRSSNFFRSGETPRIGVETLHYGEMRCYRTQIEGLLVSVNNKRRRVKPCLNAAEVIQHLTENVRSVYSGKNTSPRPSFQQELASFNIETTPGKPWGISSEDLLDVEVSMRWRRNLIQRCLKSNEVYMTLSSFPRLGLEEGSGVNHSQQYCDLQRSQHLSDDLISPHPRYQAVARYIPLRRGRKPEINLPIFRDENTPWPFHDPTVNDTLHDWTKDESVRNATLEKNHIYEDRVIVGASCSSLQITVQGKNVDEARTLYDQLIPVGPIMLALTAATPFFKGYLTDTDTRFPRVAAALDDRTPAELGEKPPTINQYGPIKPRFSSNSTYISQSSFLRPAYQDPHLAVNKPLKERLMAGGMDSLLATHFAHLFIRDPVVASTKDLTSFDPTATNHFDMLQSTNWNTVRFKPPPSQSPKETTGWRVEFRAMEVQVSDFENAAFAVTMVLLMRTILALNLNLYIPITKVEENMEMAHRRDAVLNQRFHFRKDVFSAATTGPVEDEYRLMTIDEIMNGSSSDGAFPGLIPLIKRYLSTLSLTPAARAKVGSYLSLISKRASGELWTAARWQREFVRGHPEYQRDSVLSEEVAFDLLKEVRRIAENGGEDLLRGW
ncbi:MAG: hypothetical protein Q9187_004107 [Circinaria calcarea]